jgi:Uma2 family endonuclease
MKATLRLSERADYGTYLSVEQNSGHRHEFLDGVIVAMAGGSDEHNALASRFARLLGEREREGCTSYSPDQRFWIAATRRARYSDGSVICGKPEHPAHDRFATTNPVVVIEVLSPSSEGDDEGDKRLDFQSLATLQAYVLVAQDERLIRVYRRDERGGWDEPPETYRQEQAFELPTLTTPITVVEVYERILDENGCSILGATPVGPMAAR